MKRVVNKPTRFKQRGVIVAIEMSFMLLPFFTLLFLFADSTRYYNAREQMQEVAFAVASVAANRSQYYEDVALQDSSHQDTEYQALLSLAKLLRPSGELRLVVRGFAQDETAASVTLGSGCAAPRATSAPALKINAVSVTLCDKAAFSWWSIGKLFASVRQDEELFVGYAILPQR